MDVLDDLYARHNVVHLLYSAGKDSELCARLLTPEQRARTVLVWVDTGASLPEIRDAVFGRAKDFADLVVLYGAQPKWIAEHGFPSDAPISDSTDDGAYYAHFRPVVRTCDKYACCRANIWTPLTDWLRDGPATAVIMGDKRADHYGRMEAAYVFPHKRVEVCHPLEHMTDNEVRECLGRDRDKRFELSHSSVDCWNCTAYWEAAKSRLAYIEEKHPEAAKRVRAIYMQMRSDLGKAMQGLNFLEDK